MFANSGAESVQFVLDGQCDLGTTWNARPALRVRDEPTLPLGIVWNGAIVDGDPFGIPRGARHYDAALSALGYALLPESQCGLMNEIAYGVAIHAEPYPNCLSSFARKWSPRDRSTTVGPPSSKFYIRYARILQTEWAAWVSQHPSGTPTRGEGPFARE